MEDDETILDEFESGWQGAPHMKDTRRGMAKRIAWVKKRNTAAGQRGGRKRGLRPRNKVPISLAKGGVDR